MAARRESRPTGNLPETAGNCGKTMPGGRAVRPKNAGAGGGTFEKHRFSLCLCASVAKNGLAENCSKKGEKKVDPAGDLCEI
jgi:hypothetical protein